MNITIVPTRQLSGVITAPPSKAQTHRALLAGLLSEGKTKIAGPLSCDDTEATARAVSQLGAELIRLTRNWIIESSGHPNPPQNPIDCGESGVTLRFLIPIVSLTGAKTKLTAREALMRRPHEPLIAAMRQLGIEVEVGPTGVEVKGGPPKGGTVSIPGDVSSQFISGLLFAGPSMKDGIDLRLTSALESRNYVSLTIEMLEKHGVRVQSDEKMSFFEIRAGQRYSASEHEIQGDFSSAAFLLSAAAITKSKLIVKGLSNIRSEPDAVLLKILSKMGIDARHNGSKVSMEGGDLGATNIEIRDSPDLGPITAVLGCYAKGETRISGAARLRHKESDRLAAITSELASLGAEISETEDGLIVRGPAALKGGRVRSHGDHRIAMALSVAALGATDNVIIEGADCVRKSYPNFFEDLQSLGVEIVGR